MRAIARIDDAAVAVILALLGACGTEDPRALQTSRHALTAGAAYGALTAAIQVPDDVEPDVPFPVVLTGTVGSGAGPGYYAWHLYENASWSYDAGHMVRVSSGTWIAGSSFNQGTSVDRTILLTRPAGTYVFTFVLGYRSSGHFFYDVAVDVAVTVARPPVVCDLSWRRPLDRRLKAGRTLPLQFTAFECATGRFLHDEGARVTVLAPGGTPLANWTFTGNPTTGYAIDDVAQQYQLNWKTPAAPLGTYTLAITFASGEQLTGAVLLE